MNSIINSIGPMVNTAIGYVNNLIDAFNAASGAFGFTVENIAEFNIEALKFDTSDATSQVEKLSAASRDLDWDINKLKTTIPKAGSFKDEFLSGLGNITGIGNNKSPVVPSTGSNNQVNIQIDQVNGADPEEMSAAIRTVLADQISFN